MLDLWKKYGHCFKCNAYAQEPCKGRLRVFPCKGRETYEHFCDRWSAILTEAKGYTILPEQVQDYNNGEIDNGYDAA